jgi:hypothetical protein
VVDGGLAEASLFSNAALHRVFFCFGIDDAPSSCANAQQPQAVTCDINSSPAAVLKNLRESILWASRGLAWCESKQICIESPKDLMSSGTVGATVAAWQVLVTLSVQVESHEQSHVEQILLEVCLPFYMYCWHPTLELHFWSLGCSPCVK